MLVYCTYCKMVRYVESFPLDFGDNVVCPNCETFTRWKRVDE
jgi:hypothetical protein